MMVTQPRAYAAFVARQPWMPVILAFYEWSGLYLLDEEEFLTRGKAPLMLPTVVHSIYELAVYNLSSAFVAANCYSDAIHKINGFEAEYLIGGKIEKKGLLKKLLGALKKKEKPTPVHLKCERKTMENQLYSYWLRW